MFRCVHKLRKRYINRKLDGYSHPKLDVIGHVYGSLNDNFHSIWHVHGWRKNRWRRALLRAWPIVQPNSHLWMIRRQSWCMTSYMWPSALQRKHSCTSQQYVDHRETIEASTNQINRNQACTLAFQAWRRWNHVTMETTLMNSWRPIQGWSVVTSGWGPHKRKLDLAANLGGRGKVHTADGRFWCGGDDQWIGGHSWPGEVREVRGEEEPVVKGSPDRLLLGNSAWIHFYIFYILIFKSLILIFSTYKYNISSHVISSFFIKKYFWKLKKHVTSSFSLKNNSKNLRKLPYAMSPFSIEK
jgi:hypothetical protein